MVYKNAKFINDKMKCVAVDGRSEVQFMRYFTPAFLFT